MGLYTLKEIEQITNGSLSGKGNIQIAHFATDSRKLIEPASSMFIAIEGERHDGHGFIGDLIQSGIKNFLVSKVTPTLEKSKVNYILVDHTINAFQKLASHHRGLFKYPIIGITGSNGKTILKEWLSTALCTKKNITRSPKSYNSQIGVPLSVMLLNTQTQTGIFEAGISKPGEMKKLESIIRPDQGIFTNIGQAHQENFLSLEQKVKEKLQLFKNCKELYYSSDHSLIHETISGSKDLIQVRKVTWTLSEKGSDTCFKLFEQNNKTWAEVRSLGQKFNIELPYKNKAGTENTLHIINYLIHNNFNVSEIKSAIENLQPVAMRLELVRGAHNNILINDSYNSDINSLNIALDYLKQQPGEQHALILSDIIQSGMEDLELYTEVSKLCTQAKINLIVGVGPNIFQKRHLFTQENINFFTSTEQLIQSGILLDISDSAVLVKGARKFNFENIVAYMAQKNHTTQLEINLSNLVSNLNYFRSLIQPSTGIMVMVKALAYGSGSKEIANILQHEKVSYLGVAFTDEGVELRQSGIHLPIMVMSPGMEDFRKIIENELEPEIYSLRTLDCFISVASMLQVSDYPVHIKIDSGMHRLGFQEDDIDPLIARLKQSNTIKVKWCFSHLAASDSEKHDNFTNKQIDNFCHIYNKISNALGYKPGKHILNSAGIERFPKAHYDMVRLGIGLHGLSVKNKKLLPVSALKTHISQIKPVPKGDSVGYNRHGKVEQNMKIGILPIGYADGLDRKFGNGVGQVVISGKKYRFIGDICMDMCMVDLEGLNCNEGDEVLIFGEQHPITLLAEQIGTIPYEILTSISSRVKRVYYKD